MPERLDHVMITLGRETISLPWESRDALLGEMKHLESCRPIREAFEAVGATRPVQLTLEQKAELLEIVQFWAKHVRGGYEGLPDGISELRGALADDLYDADQRQP